MLLHRHTRPVRARYGTGASPPAHPTREGLVRYGCFSTDYPTPEKRLSLLSELSHLKGMGSQQQGTEPSTKEPCRGTLSISNLRLPLNVEFVSSALAKTGKPSHYFFVLIRYGSSNIVSTPLATAVDAQKGDTIAFPTSITL
ncbi:Actin-binding protein anillin [Acipenser ruthenus]|uniref:Actin-binding protein anillin n=1 Tax=Acipenser ruthenus TaxID=7906 RepID=A0A444V3S8_ACIRT|nr:Actin-binding protein anillin [Acipenser ruthenus]